MNKLATSLLEGMPEPQPGAADYTIPPDWGPGDTVNAIMGCLQTYPDLYWGVRDMLDSLDAEVLRSIYNRHFGRPHGDHQRPFPPLSIR